MLEERKKKNDTKMFGGKKKEKLYKKSLEEKIEYDAKQVRRKEERIKNRLEEERNKVNKLL